MTDFSILQKAAKDGLQINQDQLYEAFLGWSKDNHINRFYNPATKEYKKVLAPRMGNSAYAKKLTKKLKQVEEGLKGLSFDTSIEMTNAREIKRKALMLLITLTYDNRITAQQAWQQVSRDLNQFRAELSQKLKKHFKLKRQVKISIRSMTLKEGTKRGYPAPHMIIVLERPVIVMRYLGKDFSVTYRLQSHELLDDIQAIWRQGYSDVQAVVNDKIGKKRENVFGYLGKYFRKGLETGKTIDLPVRQFAYTKLFKLRPISISKGFKQLLNPTVRLDKLLLPKLKSSPNKGEGFWLYDGTIFATREALVAELVRKDPPPVEKVYGVTHDGRLMV